MNAFSESSVQLLPFGVDHRLNNKISRLHEKCLAIELYKVFDSISPCIMKDVIPLITSFNYSIWGRSKFYSGPANSVI